MKVNYVEYLCVGSFFSESVIKKIDSKDINLARASMPNGGFGFRFFEKEEQMIDGEQLTGKPKNYSKWFYIGEKLSLNDVKYKYPDKTILISNMEMNGWSHVVKTKFGQFMQMETGDVVL